MFDVLLLAQTAKIFNPSISLWWCHLRCLELGKDAGFLFGRLLLLISYFLDRDGFRVLLSWLSAAYFLPSFSCFILILFFFLKLVASVTGVQEGSHRMSNGSFYIFFSTIDISQFENYEHWFFFPDDSSPLFNASFVMCRNRGLLGNIWTRDGQSRDDQITS